VPDRLKVVFFGSSGYLSTAPLNALLQSEHELVAVVVNESKSPKSIFNLIPLDQSDQVEGLAFSHDVQILKLRPDYLPLVDQLIELAPDLIVTSCFEKKIPKEILVIPKIASLNIHPSLLPKYRGPSPIFWQLKEGAEKMGVTLHLMTMEFDAGDIVAQKRLDKLSFETFSDLKKALSLLAVDLLCEVLENIHHYVREAKAQDDSISTYFSRLHEKI